MASTIIEVNTTNTLRSDVSSIDGELREVLRGADRLADTLRQLESMWEGEAKKAFSSAVQDDLRRLRELTKAMQNLTAKTGEARGEYDKCESAVSQIVASIRV